MGGAPPRYARRCRLLGGTTVSRIIRRRRQRRRRRDVNATVCQRFHQWDNFHVILTAAPPYPSIF